MDSKTKVFLLFVAGLLTLLALSTVLLSRHFGGQAEANLRSHLMTESRSLQRQVESEVHLFARELLLAVSEEIWSREQSQKLPNTALQKTDFTAIALFESRGSGWQLTWWAPRSNVASWPGEILKKLPGSLPLSQVRSDSHLFKQVQGPQKQSFFTLLLPLKPSDAGANRVAAGFFSSAVTSSWVDSQRGTAKEAAVFDSDGFALSFTVPQYAGADLNPHALVKKVLKKEDVAEDEVTNLRGESILYSAEKVNRTNLSVFVAQPRTSALSSPLMPLSISFGFGCAVVLLFGSMMLRFWPADRTPSPPAFSETRSFDSEVKPHVSGEDHRADHRSSHASEAFDDPDDRKEAYKVFGKSLSQTLSDPFSQILNHVQQARSVAHDDQLKEHLIVIEREARKSNRALENLLHLSKDHEPAEKTKFNPTEALLKGLVRVRSRIKEQGIAVSKSLTASHFVIAPEGQLEIIFEELIRHVLSQVSLSSKKEIEISGHDEAESVVYHLRYTAPPTEEGAEPSSWGKESLELTVVKGLVYGMGGIVSIDELIQGTITVTLRLPSVQTKADRLISLNREEPKIKVHENREPRLGPEAVVTKERAQLLPTAPEENEITFVGSVVNDELENRKVADLLANQDDKGPTLVAASFELGRLDVLSAPGEERAPPAEDVAAAPVEIRKPKVRAKN